VRRWAFAALSAVVTALGLVASAQASFGIRPGSFEAVPFNRDGTVDTVAGSHPYEYRVSFEFNQDEAGDAEGSARDVVVQLPPGLVGNATATPRCSRQAFEGEVPSCPADTQIGTLDALFRAPGVASLEPKGSVYNLVPPEGVAASFGFTGAGFEAIENASLVHGGDGYAVSVVSNNVSMAGLLSVSQSIWGVPADRGHDAERECITPEGFHVRPCTIEAPLKPFLTLPTSCGGPLSTLLDADSAEAPGAYVPPAEFLSPALIGCEALDFTPSILVQPETSAAATPTGLHVDLHLPQEEGAAGRAEAALKDAVVTLPPGLVVNPSSANGLAGCSSAAIDLESTMPAACPDASKIGTVEVDTPLLDHPLPGTVYVAAQGDNPFHSLLAIYIVVDDPITGIVVKLAGHVEPNPLTGQLTTTFANNPQLPFEDLKLDLKSGERAPLITPDTCGAKETTSDLTPWSTPEHPDATPSTSFQTTSGPHGAACAYAPAEEPNKPGFEAGTTVPLAGSYSPFVVRLGRESGSQPIGKIDLTLPPGLVGKLAGIPRCSDAQIAAARAPGRAGAQEIASPSCPSASELGSADVAAGAGSELVHVAGHVYLAGPYEGAPFSLAIITPAVAGPFDLGTVVVRSALYVDPETAQVTVRSDPIPTILDGIPLDVRSILVSATRSNFTLNPTSCERMALTGVATSALGQPSMLAEPFQVGGCAGLPFKPSLKAFTQAKTSKANGASLTVRVAQKPGEANIHKVRLQLPLALPARLTTLQKACTAAQFAANPAGCPAASIVGTAKAITPILEAPLAGPAYLVSHGGAAFPDVVFLLQGEGVTIKLVGHTNIKNGITSSKFEAVPDAPVSSFEAVFPEGPHSVLTAFGSLCRQSLVIPTTMIGQNGATMAQSTRVAVTGCARPRATIKGIEARRGRVIVALATSQPGTVVVSGQGLRTTRRVLAAGAHRIPIALRSAGQRARRRHATARVRVAIRSANGSSSSSRTLRL
jgi:hypothetical protein